MKDIPKEIKDKHINSAIIGFWRMEVDEATISAVVGCSLSRVVNTIKTYKEIKGQTNSDVSD